MIQVPTRVQALCPLLQRVAPRPCRKSGKKRCRAKKKPSGRTCEPGRPDRRSAQRRGEPRCRARRVAAAAAAAAGESPGEVREGEKEAERESERGRSREERRQDKTASLLLAWSIARHTRRGGRVVVQVDGLVISPKLRRRVLFFSVSFHLSRMQQLSPPGKLYHG